MEKTERPEASREVSETSDEEAPSSPETTPSVAEAPAADDPAAAKTLEGVADDADELDAADELDDPDAQWDDDLSAPPDFENRVLCPDGTCIGVIGPDGKCKECGARANPQDLMPAADAPARDVDDGGEAAEGEHISEGAPAPKESADGSGLHGAQENDPEDDPEETDDPPHEKDGAFDLNNRVLCSDGSCIGVVGPDNHCKVCGKPFTGEPDL